MSWIRNALNKASEVAVAGAASYQRSGVLSNTGARSNYLAGRVRQYAGAVVQRAGDAMAGGAKLMERAATGKNLNNLRHAIRRLDEVSRNARGKERTEALTRWLGALRELGKGGKATGTDLPDKSTSDDKEVDAREVGQGSKEQVDASKGEDSPLAASESSTAEASESKSASGASDASVSPTKVLSFLDRTSSQDGSSGESSSQPASSKVAASVLFYDEDSGEEPFTFRDVFLRSNALENIVVSLVKEPPTEPDRQLVLELLDLCMMGSQAMHAEFLKAVENLGPVFALYSEVKLSQDDLLRMVSAAVTGMKFNSEAERLEIITSKLKLQLDALNASESASAGPEAFSLSLKLADAARQLDSLVSQQGDDEEQRAAKIENTKGLSSDLLSKLADFESRIVECQQQLQDSQKFRGSKAEEVSAAEKVISEELQVLHKRRLKLEEELEQVRSAIAAATRRHLEIQEEKEQFDLVSSSIASRLTMEEDGLRVMLKQHKEDAKVLDEWKTFLEETWQMQQSSREGGEREKREASAVAQARLWKAAAQHLAMLRGNTVRCWEQFKAEKAKLEDLGLFGSGNQEGTSAEDGAGVKGLPADEGYRIAEFRLKNALREVEKGKAEVAVRTSGMSDPGDGPNKEHFDAIQGIIAEVDEMRREHSALPRMRSTQGPAGPGSKSTT